MSLVCWLPLTKDLVNNGVGNVTITNSGATLQTSGGKLGGCYYFDGNDYIYITTPSQLTSIKNSSICAWVKSTGSTLALGGISHNGASNLAGITLYTSGWQFSGNSSGWKYVNGGSIANTSIWHHVAVTCADDEITTYLDGVVVTTSSFSALGVTATDITSSNFLEIGCDHPGGDEYLTGYVSDFRVYNHCLSPKEIKEISKGLLLHYPLDGGGRSGDTYIKNGAFSDGATSWSAWGGATTREITTVNGKTYAHVKTTGTKWQGYAQNQGVIISVGTTYTLSFRAYSPSSNKMCAGFHWLNSSGSIIQQSWYQFQLTTEPKLYTQTISPGGSGVDRFNIMLGWNEDSVSEVYFTDVKIELGTKATTYMPYSSDIAYTSMGYNSNTEYDVSGYLHNGTRNGTFNWSSDTPRYSVSTLFTNANSNYISLGSKTFDMTSVTFSAWFKIKTAQTWSRIFDFGSSEGAGYCIGLATGSNGTTLTVWGRLGSAGSALPDKQIQTISLNTWYHAVITINSTTCNCYVNGQLVISFSINSAFPSATTFNYIYFGKSVFNADKYLDGYISDFRMYATALTADQVKELYNTPVSIANNGTLLTQGEYVEM